MPTTTNPKPKAPSGVLLAAWLLAGHLALGQSYTYTAGQNLGLFESRQLKAGESLYIPAGVTAYCDFQVLGPGVRIVNDGTWRPSQSALEYGATLTNNGTLSALFLQVRAGLLVNRGRATYQQLTIAAGARVENYAGALLTVTDLLSVAGTLAYCGGLVVERYALLPGGREEALCAAPGAPLPVTLVAFTARPVAGGVLVSWVIASELNASYYAVERSSDGQVFAEVGRVPARGLPAYRYTDQASASNVYYRLRSVDTDGAFAYSPVVVVAGAALVRRRYYNETGQQLAGPGQGFYLEVAEYENGAVERKKVVNL